jgi:hypothetical protein
MFGTKPGLHGIKWDKTTKSYETSRIDIQLPAVGSVLRFLVPECRATIFSISQTTAL